MKLEELRHLRHSINIQIESTQQRIDSMRAYQVGLETFIDSINKIINEYEKR